MGTALTSSSQEEERARGENTSFLLGVISSLVPTLASSKQYLLAGGNGGNGVRCSWVARNRRQTAILLPC